MNESTTKPTIERCIGPSYRVAKNMFSENQKSKLGLNWSEGQPAASTSTMVILIFRKICFQPRSPGGLFFFLFSGCLFYSKFMRCAPPSVPHIQSALVPPSLPRHTRTHGQARTVSCRGRCPTRRRTNR